MIYQVQVTWEQGDEGGKILAFIQAKNLTTACDEAESVVRKMRGPGTAIIEAVSGREMNQTVVLVPDGEKPRWLSKVESKDAKGQEKLPGVDKK